MVLIIGGGAGVVCVLGTYVCRYMHMQRPEEDVKCLHLSLSFLLFLSVFGVRVFG